MNEASVTHFAINDLDIRCTSRDPVMQAEDTECQAMEMYLNSLKS